MKIVWLPIIGFENEYEVSSDGQVRSVDRVRNYYNSRYKKMCSMKLRGKIRKPSLSYDGYAEVHLQKSDSNKSYYARVHRLVASAFIPNPNNLPQVNHKDGNKLNNKVDNLEWVTAENNTRHAIEKLHGCWMRNNSPTIRVKCLDEGIWFNSMQSAGNWAGGTSTNLIIAMNKSKPYKGHVFLREADLMNLNISEYEYVRNIMNNYRGIGSSICYKITGSDGSIFRSQKAFCESKRLDPATISQKFRSNGSIDLDGIIYVRSQS